MTKCPHDSANRYTNNAKYIMATSKTLSNNLSENLLFPAYCDPPEQSSLNFTYLTNLDADDKDNSDCNELMKGRCFVLLILILMQRGDSRENASSDS